MISLHHVTKIYAAHRAVDEVGFDVAEGTLLALIGESGCGKTTTLKMINRLVAPTSGSIHVDGQSIFDLEPVALRRRIGYVFQGVGLFPHYSIGDNVAVVPRLLRWPKHEIDARVDEMLELVGLPPAQYRPRKPAQLSGGQQQRVGFARALAAKPRLMLLDEPFAAVDPLTRQELQEEVLRIRVALNLTAILVTHDMAEAMFMADRIAVMREGRVVQLDTPQALVANPADDYVRGLVEMPRRRVERLDRVLHGDRP